MSKIKINHAQVESLSSTYVEAENQIQEIMSKLNKTQGELQSVWEGKAFDQFQETFQEFSPKVVEFGEFLGSVGKQLKENARVMREADEALQKANKLQ